MLPSLSRYSLFPRMPAVATGDAPMDVLPDVQQAVQVAAQGDAQSQSPLRRFEFANTQQGNGATLLGVLPERETMNSILDPRMRLRNDIDRVVLYSRNTSKFGGEEFAAFLHPKDAILLALFDGTHSNDQVAEI